MSGIKKDFLNVCVSQLEFEVNSVCGIFSYVYGKVVVDWVKFVDFEMEIIGKGKKVDFPAVFKGKAESLFEKIVFLLVDKGVISSDDLDHCYLIKSIFNDEGTALETSLEWGFYRERDAKAYCELMKQKYSSDFEWKILPPKKGPVASEDALMHEQKQMTDIDEEFARTMGALVIYHEENPGSAIINFKLLFDLEHKPNPEIDERHRSEIVQRIWGRLEEMRFVFPPEQGKGYVIYLNPAEESGDARICLNPECLRTKRYFSQECDATAWAAFLSEKYPEYEDRIEVLPLKPDECDNGERFFEDMAKDDSEGEEESDIELEFGPSEEEIEKETEDESEDEE